MSRAWQGTDRVQPNDRTADVHTEMHASKLLAIRQHFTCMRKWPGHARADRDKHTNDRAGQPDGRAGFAGPWIGQAQAKVSEKSAQARKVKCKSC